MLDGDEQEFFPGTATHAVLTPSGISHLTCKARDVPNHQGKASHFTGASAGVPCELYDFPNGETTAFTNDWEETVTPNGNGSLTCHMKTK